MFASFGSGHQLACSSNSALDAPIHRASNGGTQKSASGTFGLVPGAAAQLVSAAMRNWEPKEPPSRAPQSIEPDSAGSEGGLWEHYGPAVLAVILVVVTAGVCTSIFTLR